MQMQYGFDFLFRGIRMVSLIVLWWTCGLQGEIVTLVQLVSAVNLNFKFPDVLPSKLWLMAKQQKLFSKTLFHGLTSSLTTSSAISSQYQSLIERSSEGEKNQC